MKIEMYFSYATTVAFKRWCGLQTTSPRREKNYCNTTLWH